MAAVSSVAKWAQEWHFSNEDYSSGLLPFLKKCFRENATRKCFVFLLNKLAFVECWLSGVLTSNCWQDDEDSEEDVPDLEEKAMPMPKPFEGGNVTDDESDVELDNEGVVQPDEEAPQKAILPSPWLAWRMLLVITTNMVLLLCLGEDLDSDSVEKWPIYTTISISQWTKMKMSCTLTWYLILKLDSSICCIWTINPQLA